MKKIHHGLPFSVSGVGAEQAPRPSFWLIALLLSVVAVLVSAGVNAAVPVLQYHFDEGTGATAADASGTGYPGTLTGTSTWIPGQLGGAISFDGKNGYVSTEFVTHLPNWTVAGWVRSPSAPNGSTATGPIHREDNFVISWHHPARDFRGAAALSVGGDWYAASFGSLNANTWYHLAASYDGETLRAYRDGVLISENGDPSGAADNEVAALAIGRQAASNKFFAGDVDEVVIFAEALSAAEIADLRVLPEDVTPPVISNIATSASATVAQLSWSTNEPATTVVRYGTTPALGTDVSVSVLVKNHAVTLTGLNPDALYYFTVASVDGSDNATLDDNQGGLHTFMTGPAVVDDSVINYHLDEVAGQLAQDSSGNGHDGIVNGNASWILGQHGFALSFDGLSTYIDTGYNDDLPAWTVSSWVRSPGSPTNGKPTAPIHREDNFVISWNHPAAAFQGAAALSVGGKWYAASFGSLGPNNWYHLAATYDGETLKAYRDGVLITANAGPSGPPDAEAASLTIGKHSTANNFFIGDLDEVRIFARALDQAEIVNLAAPPADSLPPFISDVIVDPADTNALISWTTNEPSDSVINYGTTPALGSSFASAIPVTSHSLVIPNLTPDTLYYFEVRSSDSSGNLAVDNNGGAMYPFATLRPGGSGEPDADFDGMSDAWELEWGFDPLDPTDAGEDLDGDGLSNLIEFLQGSNPKVLFPGASWLTRTPAEVGLDPAIIDQFVADVGGDGVIVRNGFIVRSWGNHTASGGSWWSSSKPVLSTMLMFAVEEGRLDSVNEEVGDWVPGLIPKDASMTFENLANNTSGYMLAESPGEAWAYNDYAINLYLKVLFEQVYGENGGATAADSAATNSQRLGALGLQDGNLYIPWDNGGWEVGASARDIARIGLFWLNRGYWNDEQLISESLFDQHMKVGVPADMPLSSGILDPNGDYLNAGTNGGGVAGLLDFVYNNGGRNIYGFGWWFNGQPVTTTTRMWPDVHPDVIGALSGTRASMFVIPSLNMVVAARLSTWGSNEITRNARLKLLMDAAGVPNRPTGLIATADASGPIMLDWDEAAAPDFAGYNVYQSRSLGGPYKKRNNALLTSSDFIDPRPSFGLNHYVVTIVDTDGLESPYADEAQVVSASTGLVLHYPLDENSGDVAANITGGNDGQLINSPAWVPGPFGSGLSFNGSGSYVQTDYTTDLPEWTVSAWVRSPDSPNGKTATGPVHREDNFVLSWHHPAPAFRGAMAFSVNGEWYSASFGQLSPNTWYHLAGSYDGETLRAYRNGVLINTNTTPSGPSDSESAALTIGKQASGNRYFKGEVDEIRIYETALSDAQIFDLAQ